MEPHPTRNRREEPPKIRTAMNSSAMNSTEYSVDRQDILFMQNALLEVEKLCDLDAFRAFSAEDFALVLEEGFRFAERVYAPLNAFGDAHPPQLKDGRVHMPDGFAKAWKQQTEGGWIGMEAAPEWGGQGLPLSVAIGVMECLYGANPSLYISSMLTIGAANLIVSFGSEEQRQMYCEKLIRGHWGGTMCLSEPNHGSAVGDIVTTATKAQDGEHYLIRGTKQWISGGDHDMVENHVHLVLARTTGAPAGPKGISLFIVPRLRPTADGAPGADNGVQVVRLEHKLGIKASPTCALEFGGSDECHGYLLEGECRGLAQMFQLMNHARLVVAFQGLGAASAAYRNALAYARERVQGIPIEHGKRQDSPRTAIVEHPDVRNMLMTMKATVEGARGLIYAVAHHYDRATQGPPAERGRHRELVDILTPVAKNYGADRGFEVVQMGLQVLGGVGYTEEFPLAQHLRDAKIASIYEGTSGIQALDLVTRKLAQDQGGLFATLMRELDSLQPREARSTTLQEAIERWRESLRVLRRCVELVRHLQQELGPREAVFNATDLCACFGDVMAAYYLLKAACRAEERLGVDAFDATLRERVQGDETQTYLYNKVLTATHYVYQVLPRTLSTLARFEARRFPALDALLAG